MAPFVILFAIVFIIPIIWAIKSSFYQQVAVGGGAYGGGQLVNQFVGLQNFQYVITSGDFWAGIGRVLIYTVIQVPIMIIAALALAMLLDSFLVKHVTVFRLSYFLPYAIPGVVASIIWVFLYNGQISPIVKGLAALGINVDFFANNVVLASMANITTWTFTGYNMLIFLASLQAIPHDLYEAARIDGANGFQIAMKIKLPNVRGAALLAMLLSIVGTIQLFNEPQVMQTADPGISSSYTPMMMALNTSRGFLTPKGDGPASAIAIVMAFIAGILAMIYALVERKVNES
ncbi:carbohydrate ABC transporter permease [Bifidobacterium choloepi]|nr:sugar ABC transporter permease [Bifidobacterium choloepi]